jgi:hypothetical protein
MASGDTLCVFTSLHNEPPSSNAATLDTRNQHSVLDFDAASDESAVFGSVMPRHYDGGGVTVSLIWLASTATEGDVVWNVAFERHQDDTDDLDSDSFAAVNAATATCASASGEPQYTDVAFTDGADMDSVAAGESFRLKVTRDADNESDDMTGDAELLRAEIRET